MALIRALLLLVVVAISITWGEGAGEDRIGTLLSMMADMRNHVNSLTNSVKQIYQMEEETAEHMLKTEDRVEEIVQNEGDMTKKVGNIDTQMAQMKTQIGQTRTQITQLENKMEKDVVANTFPYGWKFYGYGYRGSDSQQVQTRGTTLQQCIEFCTKKRQDSGASWNGLWWIQSGNRKGECSCNENETGHRENPIFLHFKF